MIVGVCINAKRSKKNIRIRNAICLFSYCDWLDLCLLAKEQGLTREK